MADIPQWTIEKALGLFSAEYARKPGVPAEQWRDAFARYIANVSERLNEAVSAYPDPLSRDYWRNQLADLMEPVDPVEGAVTSMLVYADFHPTEAVIRSAIMRGIEIERERAK